MHLMGEIDRGYNELTTELKPLLLPRLRLCRARDYPRPHGSVAGLFFSGLA
jgi:hypothetical protein